LLKKVNVFNLIKDIPPDPVAGKQNPASEKQDPTARREGRGGEAAGDAFATGEGGFAGVDDGRKRGGDPGCFSFR
jgi:hypothetical protein